MQSNLNIVVTGEVDSGKSTLIGRFLYETGSLSQGAIKAIGEVRKKSGSNFEFAYLLDSLEEERNNQLTMDTTQAFCKTKKGKEFVFIDVPGHQELIKNMLCGSSYADIAILVVDVQKSVEEQTKRHAFILNFLGIKQIIVVLNKMDLVDFKENVFRKIKKEIKNLLAKIQIQSKYFIPVSAKEGDNLLKESKNMPWYDDLVLFKALDTHLKTKVNGAFRFPIQDVYSINEQKIAVGKVISGGIRKGEKVNVLPLNKELIVKEIKVFKNSKKVARVPESIGLILDDMSDLRRGQVVCKSKLPQVKTVILAKIFCVRPLNINENLEFKCLTQESLCRISKIVEVFDTTNLVPKTKNNILDKNDSAQILLRTETPVVIENFERLNALGRFVLQGAQDIVAVGIVS